MVREAKKEQQTKESESTEQDPVDVLTPEEFAEVVEVFRILKRWRDEARR